VLTVICFCFKGVWRDKQNKKKKLSEWAENLSPVGISCTMNRDAGATIKLGAKHVELKALIDV
jgi:hypothetical protein